MPSIARETISIALFTYLQNAVGFASAERAGVPFANVPSEQCPALRLYETEETAVSAGQGFPTKWMRDYSAYVYTYQPESDTSGVAVTQMNNILDAIEDALPTTPPFAAVPSAPPPPGVSPGNVGSGQNLGVPQVFEARISGKIMKSEGIFGNNSVAIVPIRVVLTTLASFPPQPFQG